MFVTLLNIVIPVFALTVIGFLFGRREQRTPDMAFINYANVMFFSPALVFSALMANPVDLGHGWPLMVAGALIILLPGALLALVPRPGMLKPAFLMGGMFRNTGNIGIPLMMLAYGKQHLGDIVVLFVISNLLHFSLGLFLLSQGQSRWQWLRNPIIWAAVLGLVLAPLRDWIAPFILTTIDLAGQVAVPLMLFSLGVRLSQDKITDAVRAVKINLYYLLAGLVTLPLVVFALPLSPEWIRMITLSILLPPAVLNYLLCELYKVDARAMAGVVLVGNLMSVLSVPLVVWATLVLI